MRYGGKKLIKHVHRFQFIFFSIYIYKAFLSRQLKFMDFHDIKNSIMPSPRLFIFKNKSKSQKKEK